MEFASTPAAVSPIVHSRPVRKPLVADGKADPLIAGRVDGRGSSAISKRAGSNDPLLRHLDGAVLDALGDAGEQPGVEAQVW